MTDMIEKMARAAHRAELALNNEKNETVIEIDWEMHGWRYIEGQRAALSALEEPSEAMLRAVEPRPSHWPKRGESPKHDAAVDTDRMCTKGKFVRMIKAAKGEE